MTVRRSRRASPPTLLGTFSRVVVLFAVARLALVQCSVPSELHPAQAPSGPGRASVAAPRSEASARPSAPARGTAAAIEGSVHVALGVPNDGDPSDEYWLNEDSFVLSYDPSKRVPNWVAWRLERDDLGHARRSNDFRPDLSLPARFYRVNESDYRHSGFDRGHLCPSADRQDTHDHNSRTFLFTNMQPQLHELNAGPWERLEVYARQRAQRGQVLYIVAGGTFSAGYQTIGNGVAVPSANFKILVVLNAGERPADVSAETEVLAVMMPNQPGVGAHEWTDYLTTVDAIEAATGYDFLTAVPEPIQSQLESRPGRP